MDNCFFWNQPYNANMTESADTTVNIPPVEHHNFLYRSRIEICRILEATSREKSPVYTEVGDDMFFVTHVLSVDPDSGQFVVAYGNDKATNSALFKLKSLLFNVSHQGTQLVFKASDPVDTIFDNQAAIGFSLPDMLIVYHHRGEMRFRPSSNISLSLDADQSSALPFEAKMIDISHDGIGFISYNQGISLKEGTVLRNCRIIIPGGKPVTVDLIVRHSSTITQKDGTLAVKTGVRFMQRPEEIKSLINIFVKDLDL